MLFRSQDSTSTWDEGVQQLDQYLSATHRTRHVNATPVYGLIGMCTDIDHI
jgi:hypothetical protein